MNRIVKFLSTRGGELGFSLVCGLAYFVIVLEFIIRFSNNGSMLLGFFFFPAIVCGMALVLVKLLRSWREQERYANMTALFVAHVVLALISVVFLVDIIV